MSLYCDNDCEHLNTIVHRCDKWKQKLTYVKRSGIVARLSYTEHETCDECRNNTENKERDQ